MPCNLVKITKQQRIHEELTNRIFAGILPSGSLLPTFSGLCREFNASRWTVNAAIRMLEHDGLICTRASRPARITWQASGRKHKFVHRRIALIGNGFNNPMGFSYKGSAHNWLLECRAMGYAARRLGHDDTGFEQQANRIREAVNEYLWDEDAGLYAPWNLLHGKRQTSLYDGDETQLVGKYAFVSCPSLLPLFAGLANSVRAERMLREYVLSEKHFRSRFGIRSLSKSSEYYNNARWGNPPRFGDWNRMTNSNWQGPVWIPLNWFVFHALLRYGFRSEAAALADDTVELIWKSIRELGFMRENYDAETGEGLYADHFASWNILSDTLYWYLNEPDKALSLFPWEEM